MNSSDSNDRSGEPERALEPGRLPGDELYMMSGGVYVLCSVPRPSTRWIASDTISELQHWQ